MLIDHPRRTTMYVTVEIDEDSAPTVEEAARAAFEDLRRLDPLMMQVLDYDTGIVHAVEVGRDHFRLLSETGA
jgi:hypothetical protein